MKVHEISGKIVARVKESGASDPIESDGAGRHSNLADEDRDEPNAENGEKGNRASKKSKDELHHKINLVIKRGSRCFIWSF